MQLFVVVVVAVVVVVVDKLYLVQQLSYLELLLFSNSFLAVFEP